MTVDTEEKQVLFTAPDVKEEMCESKYWIKKTKNAEKVIIDKKQVSEFNKKTFQKMKNNNWQEALYNLKEYPDRISKAELSNLIHSRSPKVHLTEKRYNSTGKEISLFDKKGIFDLVNLEKIPGSIQVDLGILVKKQNLRALPTDMAFAPSPEEIDIDLLQLTSLSANSPAAVLHESSDRRWVYIQNTIYHGWLKKDCIAFAKSRAELFNFLDSQDFLLVTGSRIETEPNPFCSQISNIKYQMGDILPLAVVEEIPDSIPPANQQAQSPLGTYVIRVPVRDKDGYLNVKLALLARNNDLQQGYLKFTRANLIKQAFKILGERYGWGGSFDRRDCSRFVMDIYRTVGITLPRDCSMQEKGAAGKTILFSGSIQKREEILEEMEAGDPLYMKGHVLIYLGKVNKKHYIIHDGSGYAVRDSSGSVSPVTVHSVFVMELHQLLKDGSKSYLEALETGRKFG